jgi:hypothetical protein
MTRLMVVQRQNAYWHESTTQTNHFAPGEDDLQDRKQYVTGLRAPSSSIDQVTAVAES